MGLMFPHRFRHTYACHLLDNGAPLDFIQGMLGHEKASTTQIYAQLRGERRRELSHHCQVCSGGCLIEAAAQL